jgi:hypothetical protein
VALFVPAFWIALALLVLLLAFPVEAQWYNPDSHWEKWQQRNPWMQQLDNTREKSWGMHAVVAIGAGSAIGLIPGLTRKQGYQTMCAFYLGREFYGVAFQNNRKWLDAAMDVVSPCLAGELVKRVWR